MIVLVLVHVIFVPIDVAFFMANEREHWGWTYFNLVSDLLFLTDIGFNFRTGTL